MASHLLRNKLVKAVYLFSLGIFLTGLFPLTVQALPPGAGPGRKIIVDNTDKQTATTLAQNGGVVLIDYGGFALWKVPESQLGPSLARASVSSGDSFDVIGLRNGTINTTKSPNAVPASLQQSKAGGLQLWMVQFVGPIKEEWLLGLKKAGVELVSYMPNNAYVIWADGTQITRLEQQLATDKALQWTGAYHPAYRLAPALQPNKSGVITSTTGQFEVTVQIYDHAGTQSTLTRLKALGGPVFRQPFKVLNFYNISLQLPANQIANVASWADVFNIEPYSTPQKRDEAQGQIIAGNVTNSDGNIVPTGANYLNWLASKGFPTDPALYPIVDVIDDGIDNGALNSAQPDFYRLGNNLNPTRLAYLHNCTPDSLPDSYGGHGNINAGIMGGFNNTAGFPYADSNGYHYGLGISPYGRIAGTKIFQNSGAFDLTNCSNNFGALVGGSYNSGAAITSNSWGYKGTAGAYDSSAQAFDALTRDAASGVGGNQQMLHVFAAGNSGNGAYTVESPATAKNVLTVGATENVRDEGIGCNGYTSSNNADDLATYSSRGPTADERIKPDIVAPGTHIQGPASQAGGYTGVGVCTKYYPDGQTFYTWSTGTSHSTPAIAGATSLIYNYYNRVLNPGQNPSPAMTKALLLNNPRYLNGQDTGGSLPSPKQGWGGANLAALFDGTPRYVYDQGRIFTASGDTFRQVGTIADNTKGFRVTLAWTDAPGSTSSGSAYVNDLNLQVTVGGQTYKGNVFSGQYSSVGGSPDARNNVESVFIPAGVNGTFAVKVTAANLAGDGVPGSGSLTDQDFALVITNANIGSTPVLAVSGVSSSDAVGGNNNGVIEPGETIALNVAWSNFGDLAANNVSGKVSATGGAASLTVDTSPYPTIAIDSTVSNSTTYQIKINDALACGELLSFSQTLTYNGGSVNFSFTLQTGTRVALPAVTYSSSDVPREIPDNAPTGVSSYLYLSSPSTVAKITVKLNISHTWDSDLTVQLFSPNNTSVTLIDHRGRDKDNFTDTILDDAAANPISSGSAPFTGSFQPEQALSAFNDQSIAGGWRLKVSDFVAADTGVLNSWSVDIKAVGYTCAVFSPVPTITSLSPSSIQGGKPGFNLTVNGTGFEAGSIVRWNGADHTPIFTSSTQMTVVMPTADIATAPRTIGITVYNPPVPGGTSNVANFTVTTSCNPLIVTSNSGTATGCGTLRTALSSAVSGDTIAFALPTASPTIALANPTTVSLSSGVSGVSLLGFCGPTGPGVTIDGSAIGLSTWTLGSTAQINGITLQHFRLVVPSGSISRGNVLKCSKVKV